MTSRKTQVPRVLAAYRKLYRGRAHSRAARAACSSPRAARAASSARFEKTVREALGAGYALERDIPPEADHPVSFPQADYLKILWWRRS